MLGDDVSIALDQAIAMPPRPRAAQNASKIAIFNDLPKIMPAQPRDAKVSRAAGGSSGRRSLAISQ